MAKKKVRLGRGLGALLEDVKTTTRSNRDAEGAAAGQMQDPVASGAQTPTGFLELPVEQLQRGAYQPRTHMDKEALDELARSIRSQGVLQPLLVREIATDRYEIIAGERRWRGAQLAGLDRVPAVVREISDQTAMAVGLIENIQREDLNAVEEAKGYQRLLDDFGLTHQEVSEVVGCSRAQVTNLIRLLSLHARVQGMLENGSLGMGHARALLSLSEDRQVSVATQIVQKALSVRQTEALVRKLSRENQNPDRNRSDSTSQDIIRLQEDLSTRIGAKVSIRGGRKGRLIIHYHSLDELDGILERIK